MNKVYKILVLVHNSAQISQRELSEATNLSLGTINTLLKHLAHNEMIVIKKVGKSYYYYLTDLGEEKIKEYLDEAHDQKLITSEGEEGFPVKHAVILAAGKSMDLISPPALIPFNDEGMTAFDRIITLLNSNGIEKIDAVVGYESSAFYDKYEGSGIHFYENTSYSFTGSMSSLAKVFDSLEEDFILIDGDLVFEQQALERLLAEPSRNAICCTNISGSGDEAFVDMDQSGSLIRISKDIRQMNRLNAEMIGLSKISFELFKEMKLLYANNENQWLNYEYLILQAARIYEVKGVFIDNLVWCDIDSQSRLTYLKNKIAFIIKRHEDDQQLDYARAKLREIMKVNDDEIKEVSFAGGMTNNNFRAIVSGQEYFIRIPGKCTEVMINRENEALNAQIGSGLDINVDTLYINPRTGIKITKAVPGAETLSPRTARFDDNLLEVAKILKNLHTADIQFLNEFSFVSELEKYEALVRELNVNFYSNYKVVRSDVFKLLELLEINDPLILRPCHNDLVAENFVRSSNGKLYLLDWEYSGMNDPAWDLAAFILENGLDENEVDHFLTYYYGIQPTFNQKRKIECFQVFEDILWGVWTIAKEAAGQNFGSYGIDRYNRGRKLLEELLIDEAEGALAEK